MSDQLSFLPEIDRRETQKLVEDALDTARIYKQIGFVRREMKNTPSYEERFHGPTNMTGAPAEDCAVLNVDNEDRIRELTERVFMAVSRLGKREREAITKRYLIDDDVYDHHVYAEMDISKRTFDRIKARAVYKLAFALKREVYKEPEEEKNDGTKSIQKVSKIGTEMAPNLEKDVVI